jgi:hypothetical protein
MPEKPQAGPVARIDDVRRSPVFSMLVFRFDFISTIVEYA